jgi:nitroreductase
MNKTLKSIACMALAVAGTACSSTTDEGQTAQAAESDSNPAIENIMTRTSIRRYQKNQTISADTIETILRAAMAAPTAMNKQPWTFVVLDNRAALDSLAAKLEHGQMLNEASVAIVTCGDLSKAIEGDGQAFWVQDVSAATENLLLAAHALGLGAVWTGVYPIADRVKSVQDALGLPENVIPLAIVPIGRPIADQEPKDKWLEDNVHHNQW